MPSVNPAILVWARETAGLSVAEAAAKLGINRVRAGRPEARLQVLEAGNSAPTRPLLVKMAKLYRRPLLTFYMRIPPPKGDRGNDFRTLQARETDTEPLVDALVRDVRARQSMIRAILADEEESVPLAFVGSKSIEDGIGAVLASIRQTLGFDLAGFRAQGSSDAAFGLLRSRIEGIGVFVLLAGNLGSYHSALPVEAFRGFALADPIAPFIVVNDQDAKSAWSFTLLHELAHLWVGATGVSGRFAEGQVERFCNDVASNFLLPANELAQVGVGINTPRDTAARLISEFARARLISRTLVAYRLFTDQRLSQASLTALINQFLEEWRNNREAARERNRARDSGPNYYVVRRHRLGPAMLRFVARNMSEGSLTPTKAGKLLGVKPRSVHPLLSGAALSVSEAA